MLAYLLRRIVATIPVILMVAVVVFSLLRLTPGDPAAILAGDDASEEQLSKIRVNMGLDKPIHVQFAVWIMQLLRGNFGESLLSGTSVSSMIADRVGPTAMLALFTIVLTLVVAIPLGTFAAAKRGKWIDRMVMTVSVLGFSLPSFVIGYMLIYFFALKLGWFPVQGFAPEGSGIAKTLQHLLLPAIALSGLYIALVARITRSSLVEVMGEDFIRTERAKGAKESSILLRQGLRNAAVPIVTVVGIGVASLITGVVVTESVFNLPGLGRLVVEAVLARDYPVIQGVTLFFSFVYILINLAVDVLYTVFDPRIRY
ncbi:ABC transporter permease [Comamonas sp. B21-038]|uniref:ABC transporter permease n=1 Tax=Comamonas sp. B21-038 TaxID=2918299 RepID=UPI001EFAB232|nr:ABC transporter permease [Comamonas sp. B21-038]ULR89750.1 ABC transporter permease [Comamonas sp. B21-038]